MSRLKLRSYLVLAITLFFLKPVYSCAQSCVDDFFSVNVNTLTVQEPANSIFTSKDEIVMTGNVLRYKSLLKEGWLTKFSARGTVLWSRHYYTNLYNYVVFNNVIETENETFLITGNIGDVDTTTWPVTHLSQYGVLMKVDKYGNVLWTKTLGRLYDYEAFSDIQSAIVAKDGDYVLSFNYYAYRNFNIITKMDKDGNVKWQTSMHTNAKYPAMTAPKLLQLRNGAFAFANFISVFDDTLFSQSQGFYFASVDEHTGLLRWERFYMGTVAPQVVGEITGLSEFPDGRLSFITSYAEEKVMNFRETKKVLNYVTDSLGIHLKVYEYSNGSPPFYASSCVSTGLNGERVVLMDNADAPFLMQIQTDGSIRWQKSYAQIGRTQETRSVISTAHGFYFFSFTHNGGSKLLKLVKADINGSALCVENPSSLVMQEVTASYSNQLLKLIYEQPAARWNKFPVLGSNAYELTQDYVCRKACCEDITDTASKVSLCNRTDFILPNNDTVKNSGTYSIVYKASTGCDSIVYYHVDFEFTPAVSLGLDRCMGEKDTIILAATSGYNHYTWNGTTTSTSSFVVEQPGIFKVSVTNRCGTSVDTLLVYKNCVFDIHMPNAFTPNGDNLNDVFRIPHQVSNRLISFTVFNRWGQVVFKTTDISKGWDGRYKEFPAPADTYVYHVVMYSIDGRKKVTGKGYVTLLR